MEKRGPQFLKMLVGSKTGVCMCVCVCIYSECVYIYTQTQIHYIHYIYIYTLYIYALCMFVPFQVRKGGKMKGLEK